MRISGHGFNLMTEWPWAVYTRLKQVRTDSMQEQAMEFYLARQWAHLAPDLA